MLYLILFHAILIVYILISSDDKSGDSEWGLLLPAVLLQGVGRDSIQDHREGLLHQNNVLPHLLLLPAVRISIRLPPKGVGVLHADDQLRIHLPQRHPGVRLCLLLRHLQDDSFPLHLQCPYGACHVQLLFEGGAHPQRGTLLLKIRGDGGALLPQPAVRQQRSGYFL